MAIRINRTFCFSLPSVLSLNWLFEFRCAIRIYENKKAIVNIEDANIGQVQIRTSYPGNVAKMCLFVWHQCSILALNYVIKQNDHDALFLLLVKPDESSELE